MKQNFLLKTMLLLCALIVGSSSTWADDAWEETTLSDLTSSDVFVIVGTNASGSFAMTNDNGTSKAPVASQVTIANGKITSAVADKIKWNVSGNATDGYVFYPDGKTDSWLYCTNTNNGVRVGTNQDKTFKIDSGSGYIIHDATSRYVGIYSSSDWRCYTTINANIKNQTFSFYKKVSAGPTTYTVTYDGNGNTSGDVPTDENAYTSGATVTVLGNTGNLAKTGFTFGGWNTLAEGTGDSYDEGDTFEITDDITLYAKWNAKTITGLSYTGTPTKTNYEGGESFDPTGLTVTATFNDASSEDVTTSVVWTPDPLTKGTTSVTGTYMGLTINVGGLTVTAAPGSEENPYTVAQAIAATPATGTSDDVYIHGIVSAFQNTTVTGDGSNYRYFISDDGTTSNQLLVFKGKGIGNVAFSDADDLRVGDVVTIKGGLTIYNTTKEVAANNYIVSLKLVAPTFDPAAGSVTSGTKVAISDAHTDATIYYTTDDSDPTTSSTEYTTPIEITTATTIKAIAVIDGYATSDVASATYTIDVTPSITIDATDPIEVSADDNGGELALTYANLTINEAYDFDVQFYDENDDEITDPDWIAVIVDNATPSGYKVSYAVDANTGEARSAYFKVWALDDNSTAIYSNKVTITQAKYVASKTYTLATSITPGKHYIITNGSDAAMGYDKGNNRAAEDITINAGVATVAADNTDVYEFVIYGPDANGYYTIYDALHKDKNQNVVGGYLHAASNSSNNLKTRETNSDLNGKWSISFSDDVAVIKANGSYSRKVMRYNYNNGNDMFSCYAETNTMADIYLYEKDGDTPVATTISKTLNASGYATFATTEALDFLDADADGVEYSAWQITNVSNNAITFEQIKGHVEAGTGILLKGSAGAEINLNILPAGGASLSENKLEGITTATTVAADTYFGLSGNKFVKVGAGTIPAGKALLPASEIPAAARELTFIFDGETTGIEQVESSKMNVEGIYNLNGQKVQNLTKGLYIMNGKKVVIK